MSIIFHVHVQFYFQPKIVFTKKPYKYPKTPCTHTRMFADLKHALGEKYVGIYNFYYSPSDITSKASKAEITMDRLNAIEKNVKANQFSDSDFNVVNQFSSFQTNFDKIAKWAIICNVWLQKEPWTFFTHLMSKAIFLFVRLWRLDNVKQLQDLYNLIKSIVSLPILCTTPCKYANAHKKFLHDELLIPCMAWVTTWTGSAFESVKKQDPVSKVDWYNITVKTLGLFNHLCRNPTNCATAYKMDFHTTLMERAEKNRIEISNDMIVRDYLACVYNIFLKLADQWCVKCRHIQYCIKLSKTEKLEVSIIAICLLGRWAHNDAERCKYMLKMHSVTAVFGFIAKHRNNQSAMNNVSLLLCRQAVLATQEFIENGGMRCLHEVAQSYQTNHMTQQWTTHGQHIQCRLKSTLENIMNGNCTGINILKIADAIGLKETDPAMWKRAEHFSRGICKDSCEMGEKKRTHRADSPEQPLVARDQEHSLPTRKKLKPSWEILVHPVTED